MPNCARKKIVPPGKVGVYHCISRCVRRAFLCGDDALTGKNFDHRRDWIQQRLKHLCNVFAIELGGYAVMSNHYHVVLRTRPDIMKTWDDSQVAQRWLRLCPKRRNEDGTPAEPSIDEVMQITCDPEAVARFRERLSDLSWFMKCLNEYIARKANKEDGCKGRFWEGRYYSQALKDAAAILTCHVYVDLNPIRAQVATTPEASDHTSVQDRIVASQAQTKLTRAKVRKIADRIAPADKAVLSHQRHRSDWLCPLGEIGAILPHIKLADYLRLVDWTGRQLRRGKAGAIPSHLRPILQRLEIDVEHWVESVTKFGRWFHHTVGSVTQMLKQAAHMGQKWLHGISGVRQMYESNQVALAQP